jgi:CBS domain-containing protein
MAEGVSLYHAVEILTRGIHRVPVVTSEGGPVVNIVSQSSVVRFLAQQSEVMSCLEARNLTWKTLKVSHDKPFVVSKHDTAVAAFSIISQQQIEAVAIVNKHGAFRASLSISDLRVRLQNIAGATDGALQGLTYELFERLQMPVLQFVKDHSRQKVRQLHSLVSFKSVVRRSSSRQGQTSLLLTQSEGSANMVHTAFGFLV